MLAIGYTNFIAKSQIISIHDTCTGLKGQSAQTPRAIKRIINDAKLSESYIDCTRGRKRRSIIVTAKYVYASIIAAKTLDMHWRGEKHD